MAPAEDSLAPFDIKGKSGNSAGLQQIVRTWHPGIYDRVPYVAYAVCHCVCCRQEILG